MSFRATDRKVTCRLHSTERSKNIIACILFYNTDITTLYNTPARFKANALVFSHTFLTIILHSPVKVSLILFYKFKSDHNKASTRMNRKQGKQSMSSDSEPIMLESLGSNTEPEPSVDAKCCISVPISARMVIVISVPLIFLLGLTIQALVLSIEHQRGSFIALTTVEQSIAISKFVNKMQIERGLTAVFISTNRTDFYSYNKLLSARGETEMEVSRLSNIPTIMVEEESTDSVMEMMDVIREHRTNADISQPIMTFEENIEFYTYINDQLLKATSRGLKVREEDRWLMAFSFLLSVGDIAGVQRALGASYFGTCILSKENKKWLTELIIRHETFLELAFTFHPESKEIYDSHIDDLLPVREEIDLVLRNLRNDSYSQACMQMLSMERNDKRSYYFDNMTIYIDKVALLVSGLAAELSSRFKNENTKATNDMALYIFIMVLVIISVLVTSYILYSFSSKMQSTTSSLKDTVLRLLVEKVRSDKILKGMPNAVVERILNDSPMMPQYFDNVTVYVSDVVGFADLANVLSQAQTLDLLHKLDW